jgi:hypothetical protein
MSSLPEPIIAVLRPLAGLFSYVITGVGSVWLILLPRLFCCPPRGFVIEIDSRG